MEAEKAAPADTEALITELYALAGRSMDRYRETGDDDFAFARADLARFRVNAYRQRGSLAAVVRVVAFRVPDWRKLGIPEGVMDLAELRGGMVLVTGTGMQTEIGKIASLMNDTKEKKTPLQVSLDDFSKKLAMLIMIVCAVVFLLSLYRRMPLLDALMFAVALAVARHGSERHGAENHGKGKHEAGYYAE